MAENAEVQIMEDNPPPALKKRATRRGLTKQVSAVHDDLPQVQSHVTNVYSSCVQRSALSLSSLPRKPLFSKHSNGSDEPVIPDVTEPPRRKKQCQEGIANTAQDEPVDSAIVLDDDHDEDENSELSTDDVSIIRSPSPVPPPPPVRIRSRPKRVSRGIQKAFKALDSIRGELKKGAVTSPQTPSVVIMDSPEQNDSQIVRVRHINDIHRFSMAKESKSFERWPTHYMTVTEAISSTFDTGQTEMFHNLQTQMASLLGVRVDRIGLYLNDSRLASSDTPLSMHLHLADIIVCHILVSKKGEHEALSRDSIRIQMQCPNSRQKSSMDIKKFLPFRVMMEKYAQKQGKPLEKFQFHFDGEPLLPDMLPNDVELDDDDTIDVVEKK